ncbi:MAG TPA: dienelactone hydrolase family protein [Iamia sp.]|nr:dienelactone hydrolase family protein [Iamia sp.]
MSPRRHAGTAYVVTPPGGEGPGVLVLHAWWGLTPFFKGVADRLADAGFVALAPDLFAGETASTPDEAEALQATSSPNETAALVLSAAGALDGLPATTGPGIGVVGFSMGGSWALWAATRLPEVVGAVVTFYGTTDLDPEPGRAAVQAHFAELDELVSDDEKVTLEAELRLLGRPVEVHHYSGTGHWFFEDDHVAAHDPIAAELAWERTIDFLHRHLDPPEGAADGTDPSAPPDAP